MRKLLINLCLLLQITCLSAQNSDEALSFYADVLLHAEEVEHRTIANERFLALIQKALQKDSAFQDSIATNRIPLLYAPDSSFRIISWELYKEDNSKSFGILQKRGSAKLITLKDRSEYLATQEYGYLYPERWLGAVYTTLHSIPGEDSLFLLRGYNSIDQYSTLHILEVLNFKDSELRFGSPVFENEEKDTVHRRIYEVASGANFRMEISDSLQRIVNDHLTSVPYNRKSDIMVNVPDGTYEVLEWKDGHWEYKERLFEQRFQELPMEHVPKRKDDRDIFGRDRD